MGREQFQVRIEEDTQQLIKIYENYLNAITGLSINSADMNRAIVEEGIKSLIKKRCDLDEKEIKDNQEVLKKNFDEGKNGLYDTFISEDAIAEMTSEDQEKIHKKQIEAGKRYNDKQLKGGK